MPPEAAVIPLSELRADIEKAIAKSNAHCDAQVGAIASQVATIKDHTERRITRELAPLQQLIDKHDLTLHGRPGDSEPGLVRGFDLLRVQVKNMEATTQRSLAELIDEIRDREVTNHGRTPRNGTTLNGEDEPTSKSGTIRISKDTLKWLIPVVVALLGGSGVTALRDMLVQPPADAVEVTAKAVADKQAELERRERELARRERRAGAVPPPMPTLAPEPAAEH